jgi:hypothetical protein
MAATEASAGRYVCDCCHLWYPIPARAYANVEGRMHQSSQVPARCTKCKQHQGDDPAMAVYRAEEHAFWYWELHERGVDRVRDSLRQVEEAEVRVGEARERAAGAYRSRDHAVRQLRKIANLHSPAQHGCSCGKKPDCDTAKIVDTPWVTNRIRDLEERDQEETGLGRRFEYDEYGAYDEPA